MSVTVVINVHGGNNGGTTLFTLDNWGSDEVVSFSIIVTNPCWTTTIDPINFSENPIQIVDGDTGTITWTQPPTAV